MDKCGAAYLAGLIDGDGYLGIYRKKGKSVAKGEYEYFVRIIGVASKELRELAESFGGHVYLSQRNTERANRKTIWSLTWIQRKAVPILKEILPHLRIKGPQAQCLLEFAGTYDAHYHRGKEIPAEVRQKRAELYQKLHELNSKYGRTRDY